MKTDYGYCTFSGMQGATFSARETSGTYETRCPRCGKAVKMRRNAYGTPLGIPRHKQAVPDNKCRW